MIDIPRDRPLNDQEYKALIKEVKEAKEQLIVARCIYEVVLESTVDDIKKADAKLQLERINKALASLPRIDS